MILVFGGMKGGTGKTMLSTNIAVLRSLEGKKLLLVDADDQCSSINWSTAREMWGIPTNWTTIQLLGSSLRTQVSKLKHQYDDIIIDIGGKNDESQRNAMTIADTFITTFQPSSVDLWTLSFMRTLMGEALRFNSALKAYSVINMGEPQGDENQETFDILKDCSLFQNDPLIVGRRKVFKKAWSEGMSVAEFQPSDKKAIQEMKNLYEMIYA